MFKLSFLFILFFLSGAAGLLYQVMWMKELSLLFGSSTQSAAVTTAAFFLGLAVGAHKIGDWVKSRARKDASNNGFYLGFYAGLEIAIASSALLYFLIYPAFNSIYASMFEVLQAYSWLLLIVKLLLAIALLSIPAFFMGGTLPVMAELVVDSQSLFARRVAGIYFINTLGACAGAIAGGFWLPRVFGFNITYIVAIAISISLALLAWGYRYYYRQHERELFSSSDSSAAQVIGNSESELGVEGNAKIPCVVMLLAAWSGFATLALQVLWTRLFSQVLQNSTYTYSAILSVFLFALTIGALIAQRLAKIKRSEQTLAVIMLISAIMVALTPTWYMALTNDMSYVGGKVELTGYVLEVIGLIAAVIGPAVVVMGVCLPYLYKLVEQSVGDHYAQVVGRINAINTFAAIVGSLLAGFVMFYWLGTWQAIYSIALCYLFASILLMSKQQLNTKGWYGLGTAVILVILLNPSNLPVVSVDPIDKKERLIEVWEGSAGTVAVVESDGNLRTKLNNWYALGGSGASQLEAMQTHLPVNLHEQADSVFYLGLGTGITSGTILDYSTKKVIVAELVDEVISASERYFTDFNNGLFDDPRVNVVNEDGRHYLKASRESFDLIIADLFIPWRAGVGSLYALEHYEAAKQRLADGGYYVQWLPMYQISEAEFSVIAKTMLQTFPMVTAWRGDFFADKPVIALIGHKSEGTLKNQTRFRQAAMQAIQSYRQQGQIPLSSHYIGQIHESMPFLADVPINTDDNSLIAYQAPASHRAEKSGQLDWLTGTALLALMRQMQSAEDTYLQGLSEQEVRAIYAGYFLHAAQMAKELGDEQAQKSATTQFNQLLAQ
jgi:spermidine synthase